jgi:hypothetical protein
MKRVFLGFLIILNVASIGDTQASDQSELDLHDCKWRCSEQYNADMSECTRLGDFCRSLGNSDCPERVLQCYGNADARNINCRRQCDNSEF